MLAAENENTVQVGTIHGAVACASSQKISDVTQSLPS